MNIPAYLTRLNYSTSVKPDAETLHGLQVAHLLNVPFENLDIGVKRAIQLSEEALWEKIIVHKHCSRGY